MFYQVTNGVHYGIALSVIEVQKSADVAHIAYVKSIVRLLAVWCLGVES